MSILVDGGLEIFDDAIVDSFNDIIGDTIDFTGDPSTGDFFEIFTGPIVEDAFNGGGFNGTAPDTPQNPQPVAANPTPAVTNVYYVNCCCKPPTVTQHPKKQSQVCS